MAAQIKANIERMLPLSDTQYKMLLGLDLSTSKPAETTATAEVSPQQRQAIEALSSESGDPYEACLWVWMQVSENRVRRLIERESHLPIGSLDNQLPLAARTFLQLGIPQY